MGTQSEKTLGLTKSFLSLLAAIAFIAAGCAKVDSASLSEYADESGSGIIGGKAVSDADPMAKTIVAIYDSQQQTLCTGSIISEQLVLTAGHCANQENPRALILIFGTKLPSKNGPAPVTRQVVDLRVNPRYVQLNAQFEKNPALNPDAVKEWGDVALLKFVGGLPPGFEAAHLMQQSVSLLNGQTVRLAGYGEIDGNRHIGSNQLNQVDVKIADANYAPSEVVMDQRSGKGACHGDSGGPAYANVNGRLLLFGVTSRGVRDPKNNCGTFAVYSKIPGLLTYLTAAAKNLLASPIPAAQPVRPAPRKVKMAHF